MHALEWLLPLNLSIGEHGTVDASVGPNLSEGLPTFPSTFFFFVFFRATPTAYAGSQARGLIVAVAAALRHSHGNSGSEPCLQPTPHLTAMLDP